VRSLAELESDWTIDDMQLAHEVLDELDRAEAEGRRRARQEAESQRRR
jgi:hypothetical protein